MPTQTQPTSPQDTTKPLFKSPWVWSVGVALLLLFGAKPVVLLWGTLSTSIQEPAPVSLKARRGEAFIHMVGRWKDNKRIQNPHTLLWLARFRGDAVRIKAGVYTFEGRLSANSLLDKLVRGSVQQVLVTIPEGFTLKQIAARLEEKKVLSAKGFLQLSKDQHFIRTLNLPFAIPPKTLEGLLFPETYVLSEGMEAKRMLRVMVGQFLVQAWPLLKQKAQRTNLTPYQALIMASIVEKESGAPKERPLIASVFHNRLKRGMKLQSDPTVIYGIEDYNGNITRKHLRTYTPYNTYSIQGLTPTPIANPGKESMQAVVQPTPSHYLFFVGKGNGLHHFSRTLREHNWAVFRYQIEPLRQKRKRSRKR